MAAPIRINRAPVLTLWAAVGERLGFDRSEAYSLGRAVARGKAVDPARVEAYMKGKFGDDLPAVRAALRKLARGLSPTELAGRAYPLYERFRPEVSEGGGRMGREGRARPGPGAGLAAETRQTRASTRPAPARKTRAR